MPWALVVKRKEEEEEKEKEKKVNCSMQGNRLALTDICMCPIMIQIRSP
jgi:hypothetical protein